ncbi:hypothetical protein K439DRAFT_1613424 [Ramaria rubella]|nr:hypothetical protein K439DRAFT_1613424 [Ramaria rubella]
MSSLAFGTELPDKVDKISSISDVQLDLLSDLRDLFRERVALEREYATKLQTLAKKAGEKKAKRMSKLVLGDDPTVVWTEETVKMSTFDNAYSKLLSSLENGAHDHMLLADSLSSQVLEDLKKLDRKNEEAKKKQIQFFEKVLADKDKTSADRVKYDEECMEVAAYRHKQERHGASDDKHADRAAKHLESQKVDMLNRKNIYLIALTISNKAKNKFYEQDLPLLENHSQSLLSIHFDSLQSHAASVDTALSLVDPVKDQDLFIEYNRDQAAFKIPEDSTFQPCEGFYDTSELNIEPTPKVFLQNKLSRCRVKLKELQLVLESKKNEVDKLDGVVSAYTEDRTLGDLDEVKDNHFEAQRQLTFLSTSQAILVAEIDIVSSALGGDEGSQQPHSFKSSSFSIPTQCGYCKSSIWGLSKQGKTCKRCGLAVHSRCELKVPAECGAGNKGNNAIPVASPVSNTPPRTSIESEDPISLLIQSYWSFAGESSTPSSFARPHGTVGHDEHSHANVLFSFEASSPFELSISAGDSVTLLEVDDGSGWIKIADSRGGKGLVPASYVELSEEGDAGPRTPPSPVANDAPPQGCGVYVQALYTYTSQGADELGFEEGETFELSAGPEGGQNYADGWWEGIHPSGRKGIFPSNYYPVVDVSFK